VSGDDPLDDRHHRRLGALRHRELEEREWLSIDSPFGKPSDDLLTGRIGHVRFVFLPRHGRGHVLAPTTSITGRISTR
jgi:purine nucleoside phosphorylase